MKTRYLVFGGIALSVTAMGMVGAGTAVYCLMNRRPPEYSIQPQINSTLPTTATSPSPTPPAENRTEQWPKNEKPLPPKPEPSPENLGVAQNDSSHSIIINGHKITEEELRAFASDGSDDDISRPVTVRHINPASPDGQPMHNNSGRMVLVNGLQISDRDLSALDMQNRAPIPNGRYWYDRISGAWGYDGGPCEGFIATGMALGGKLRADASNGDTGVFVNGRQLHRKDVAALQQLGPVVEGRYWVDAQANWGPEGGPMMGNLKLAAAQVAQRSGGNSGSGNGSYAYRSSLTDSGVGGDGHTFYYIDKNSSYVSSH